jgi:hypothetical protein
MHQRAIKPSHTLSVVSLSNPEKQNPIRNARSRRYAMAKKASGIIIVIIELRVITSPQPL